MADPQEIAQFLLDLADEIRYVAVYRGGTLYSAQRENLAGASTTESDKYEELIVNPTLITLVRQRGNIDCGGMEYVLIRYGSFFELVIPLADGHLSVGIDAAADALALATAILGESESLMA